MKTLKLIGKSFVQLTISIWTFVKNNTYGLSFMTSSLSLCALVVNGCEYLIPVIAWWIVTELFIFIARLVKQAEDEERKSRISSAKRITQRDSSGNFFVRREDIHKAVIMLGELEDMMGK